MKNSRTMTRVGVAVVAVIIAVLIGYRLSSSRLEQSARAYVDEAAPRILDAWSEQELLKRASAQFRQGVDPEELRLGFSVMAHRLGLLKSCDGSQGDVREAQGRPVTARYDARCRFEHGEAVAHVTLLRVGSQWQVLGFSIDSPALRAGGAPGLKPYGSGAT